MGSQYETMLCLLWHCDGGGLTAVVQLSTAVHQQRWKTGSDRLPKKEWPNPPEGREY